MIVISRKKAAIETAATKGPERSATQMNALAMMKTSASTPNMIPSAAATKTPELRPVRTCARSRRNLTIPSISAR